MTILDASKHDANQHGGQPGADTAFDALLVSPVYAGEAFFLPVFSEVEGAVARRVVAARARSRSS